MTHQFTGAPLGEHQGADSDCRARPHLAPVSCTEEREHALSLERKPDRILLLQRLGQKLPGHPVTLRVG
jgi:hypothetical protein